MNYCYVITNEYPNFFGEFVEEDDSTLTLEKPAAITYPGDGSYLFGTDFVPSAAEVNYENSFQVKISKAKIYYTVYMDETQPLAADYIKYRQPLQHTSAESED